MFYHSGKISCIITALNKYCCYDDFFFCRSLVKVHVKNDMKNEIIQNKKVIHVPAIKL